MLAKVIAVAGLVVGAGLSMALAEAPVPAELPPADYQGQSYVDSQGCVFLRAGYNGEEGWVPRVGQDRKAICGQTPTQVVVKMASAIGQVQEVPLRKADKGKPNANVASPYPPVTIGCPISVPVARRYATTDGGSVVLCTATNGSLTGARSPVYPAGSGVGAALSSRKPVGVTVPLGKHGMSVPQMRAGMAVPDGYELAWKDGRLNPLRGKGTVAGQAAQDQIWTRDVPAVAVVGPAQPKAAGRTTVSASNRRSASAIFVQVGAFGQPSNADGAAARVAALGLPVSRTTTGTDMQLVYAGPFASGADAAAALRAARSGGFSDAFIR